VIVAHNIRSGGNDDEFMRCFDHDAAVFGSLLLKWIAAGEGSAAACTGAARFFLFLFVFFSLSFYDR